MARVKEKIRLLLSLVSFVVFSAIAVSGCNQNPLYDSLTEKEVAIQHAADAATASILFANEMDNQASYIVDGSGHVHIKFVGEVRFSDYNRVVEQLRADSQIRSVFAEQSGSEVCPLSK
ncbi:hypothetical protein J3998_00035 [Thiomicrorhabdus sp. 6S2-11]|uniref:BON domain-containing protein n=1 Tax=Thiomicrorhabdus marina TaxID=2818442 RepID=A0ABS3Q0U9_9GAMM|nr:hypothetical protein [Thiomicrorhabdus marina]MBO1925949.1 hypothetical protein [Thiomicrorhabdus marina]